MDILNYVNSEWIEPDVKEYAVEFFTQKKDVVERWPKEWSRRF
jgi:hypothetical protein